MGVQCWFNVGFILYRLSGRKHRKMHDALNQTVVLNCQGIQLNKVHQLVKNILHALKDMEAHFRTRDHHLTVHVVHRINNHESRVWI